MQTDRNNPHTRIDCANTQANTSDGAVVILAFIETVRFLRKDSAKTLSLICQLSANADNIANIRKLAHIRIDFGGIMQAVGNER